MLQIHLAVVPSLGCIFALIGPVASAENTFTLPPTSDGMMAIVKNTIPNPPIHCVIVRQNSSAWGSLSTSSRILHPVVVNPEIVSKKASVKLPMYPLKMNGSEPKRLNIIQVSVTSR